MVFVRSRGDGGGLPFGLPVPGGGPTVAHVVLHDCATASETVLIPKPVEHGPGRVALIARPNPILAQPLARQGGPPRLE